MIERTYIIQTSETVLSSLGERVFYLMISAVFTSATLTCLHVIQDKAKQNVMKSGNSFGNVMLDNYYCV